MNEKPKTSMFKRLLGLGRKTKTSNKIEMSPFQQNTPSKEEIKLLEYKGSPIISSSSPPKQLMSDIVFGPAKARQAATAPHAISTQTSEVQTEQLTQAAITSGVNKGVNEIRLKHGNLGFGPFSGELKPVLEKLGIPMNMRKPYYVSGFERYKQMQASTRLDLGHNSGLILP